MRDVAVVVERSRRRLIRSERGATAIEYGLIAGLIALGLVGSLVTTRGSISAIFGTASSQMGSASSGTGAPAQPARFSYWAGKTVQSNTTTSSIASRQILTSLTYSDGTTVSLKQEIDANGVKTGRQYLQIKDYATNVSTYYYVGYNGEITTFEQDTYKSMPPVSANQTLGVQGLYSGGALTNVRTSTYSGSSTATSSTTAPPTPTYQADVANAATDLSYFLSYVPAGL